MRRGRTISSTRARSMARGSPICARVDSVEFDVGDGPKGPRAENVRRTSM
jgi:cold shock CspA family protein